jgi:alpha-tubulin suppressor-like RCC1 family protein
MKEISQSSVEAASVSALLLIDLLGICSTATAGTRVAAWGRNDSGQAEIPPGLSDSVAVAAGFAHSLALKADGTVVAWGDNSYGQTNVPAGLTNVLAVAAGANPCLALKADGTVEAWGSDDSGETEVPVGLSNVVAVAAGGNTFGGNTSLALKADGTVRAWGWFDDNPDYQPPAGLSNVVAVGCGNFLGIALKADGSVISWPVGGSPAAGDPTLGLSNVVAISCGTFTVLALKADGTAEARGTYFNGLGGSSAWFPADLTNLLAVAASDTSPYGMHDLGLRSGGTVVAFDVDNTNVVAGLSNVLAIATRGGHSLVLIGDGPPLVGASAANLRRGQTSFSLSLQTQSGRVYALEYKNSLQDNVWTALPLVAGTGGLVTLKDPTASAPQRFYRVRRW